MAALGVQDALDVIVALDVLLVQVVMEDAQQAVLQVVKVAVKDAKDVMVDVKVVAIMITPKLMIITAIQDKVVVIHLEKIHHAQVEDMMENKI